MAYKALKPRSFKFKKIKKFSDLEKYPDTFGDHYLGKRYEDREIAVEKLTDGRIRVCLCLPYDEKEDSESGKIGKGASEVLQAWVVKTKLKALQIINEKCLTPVRMDKLEYFYE